MFAGSTDAFFFIGLGLGRFACIIRRRRGRCRTFIYDLVSNAVKAFGNVLIQWQPRVYSLSLFKVQIINMTESLVPSL